MSALPLLLSLPSFDSVIDCSPLTAAPETRLFDAIALLTARQPKLNSACVSASYVLIVADSQVMGWLTQTDILRLLSSGVDFKNITISEVMHPSVITLQRSELQSITSVVSLLQEYKLPLLPVVDEQARLLGIITFESICQGLQPEATATKSEYGQESAFEALQKSEERFRTLVEYAADAFFLHDFKGKIVDVNQRACESLGYSREELLGLSVADIEQNLLGDQLWEFIETGVPVCINAVHKRQDGTTFPVEVNLGLLELRGQRLILALARDITQRQQVEERLAQAKEQLQAVLDAVPGFVSWVSADGHYLGVNRHLAESFELSGDDFVGEELGFMQSSPDFANFMRGFLASSDLAASQVIDAQIKGTTRNYLIAAQKYQQGTMAVSVGIDISDRKLAEAALLQAQADLKQANEELEMRVASRTDALKEVNRQLVFEISDRQLFEEQLRQSQEMLQLVMDNIPQSIFWKDQNCVYLGCNLNFAKAAGFNSPDDITGKTDYDLFSQQQQADFYHEFDIRVMQTNTPAYHIISPHQQADGKHTWVETNKIPLHDAQGNVVGVLGTSEDITDRKRAEESLRLRDRAIAASSNGIVISDATLADSPIIYVNPAFERMTNYTAEEVIGLNSRFLQDTDTNQPGLDILSAAMGEGRHCTVILRNYRKDGTLFWNELSVSPVVDTDGKLTHYIGIQTDITERKQAEIALLVSQERLQHLLSSSPGVIYTFNCYGNYDVTFISENVAAMLGYQAGEFLEDSSFWMRHIHPDDANHVSAALPNLFLQGYGSLEYRFLHQDGTYRWMFDQAKVVQDEAGKPLEILGYWADITSRKQLEQELRQALEKEKELNELKSRFISMTSHEFRTPLSTILSSAELLEHYRHKWTEEKQLTHLHRIQTAVKHMNEMLNDVLFIGKAEAGKLEFRPTSLDLVEYCRYLVEEVQLNVRNQHNLAQKSALIVFSSQYQSMPVCMDEKLLGHILSNLLSNAIKYSPSGSTVKFNLTFSHKRAVFQIQDEGIGIPREDLPRLFESFHRATNVGNIQGTGLGLAIVKKCVDEHQGEIAVTSELRVGTTFTVTLPCNNQMQS